MSSETGNYDMLVEKWDTETLITFLKEQDLNLDEKDFDVLRRSKITGRNFLKLERNDFRECGLVFGSAVNLAGEVESLRDRTKSSFSSYRTVKNLKEALSLHKICGDSITDIPRFEPVTHKLDDDDQILHFCVKDIKRKLENMGSVVGSNDAIRCEYISSILHASVTILKNLIKARIKVSPQFEVSGINNSGRVNYTIRKIADRLTEEILRITEGQPHQLKIGVFQNIMQCRASCESNRDNNDKKRKAEEAFESEYEYVYGIISTGTDWIFLLYTTDDIYCSQSYQIPLKDTLDDTGLKCGIKEILEIIVGLLEDRAKIDMSPAKRKQRIQEYFKKEGKNE